MARSKGISSFSVLLLSFAAALVGVASLRMINVQYTPSSPQRSISVSCSMPQASARTVEAEVVSKLEGILSSVPGCTDIASQSKKNMGTVSLVFRKGTDMAAARFDVASRIRSIYDQFPPGTSYPEISLNSSGEVAQTALTYEIRSSIPTSQIYEYAQNHVIPILSRIEGVEKADIHGATPYRYEVTFDSQKTESMGISGRQIMEAVQNSRSHVSLGLIKTETGTMMMSLETSVPDLPEIPVCKVDDHVVFLRDIATWKYVEAEPTQYYRVNGLNTVSLSIAVSSKTNLLNVAAQVKSKMEQMQKVFPTGMSARLSFDSSEYVRTELARILRRTSLCILILLLFVFITSLSLRYTVMIAITILLNLLVSLSIYSFAGLSVHIYTLAGISVSLGIVIDTTIVMMDHYRQFHDRKTFPAILGAVMTTVFALLMILLLPESEKRNLSDFMIVIMINLSVSLVVAWFFVPAFVDLWPSAAEKHRVSRRSLRWKAKLNHAYSSYISWGIRFRWLMFVLLAAAVGLSFYPFYKRMDKVNFYREPERLVLNINAGMLEGSTVGQLNEVVKSMENYLSSFDGIELFTTSISSYADANIRVYFKPEVSKTGFPQKLKSDVTSMAINFGGANWRISGIDDSYFNNNVVTNFKSNSIVISGYNFDRLLDYCNVLKDRMKENPRVSGPEVRNNGYWNSPAMEFNMAYDFEKMGFAGVSPEMFHSELSSKLYMQSAGRFLFGGKASEVVLQSSDKDCFDLWHVLNEPVSVDSVKVDLSTVGSITKERSGLNINKANHVYELCVAYDFIGSGTLHKRYCDKMVDWMNDEVLPVGFKARSGSRTWFDEHKDRYIWLILLIIIVIYGVCAITLESFLKPLSVVIMIPVSFIGAFLVFGMGEVTFDQGGFASLVMLCGLTVNAAIYILMACRGIAIRDYVKAFDLKVIPIFLTVISTVLGLIPFLSDGPSEVFWFSFASGTIAGMLFSILAIILALPLFVLPRRAAFPRNIRQGA